MATTLHPDTILAARAESANLRERDLAAKLGVPEAALVAAEVGHCATRIAADPATLLGHVKALGEVMVLTRNETAVHEKIGHFEELHPGRQVSMTLGKNIDLRIFGSRWKHGFAVTRDVQGDTRRSLQFFDGAGVAVFKIHLRPASDIAAFDSLVDALRLDEQDRMFVPAAGDAPEPELAAVDREALRREWQAMTDPHQFFGMLKRLRIGRQAAIRAVGEDIAWSLDRNAVSTLLERAAVAGVEIMCFVSNPGCVQIHTGTVSGIQRMGPWVNVMDPTFHLHVREDRITEVWAVRKPSDTGHVTSIEAYDRDGEMVIQFFGKRKEGMSELNSWRALAEGLPRSGSMAA
ncbi:hemin-degrading factor [Gellertiella hungarica]|uniref:Putative hemin transport protein n=1 Tax=Gellertiella hungarica TaxID=1572859 RepID=A0A7W6NKR9_9HYPH|nr:ChuX/HutX family heme-like substrate-binding protein [Gellertiella hungarica]MBB4064824.1 putative hemin transport protein [Gellertiella hungarica]